MSEKKRLNEIIEPLKHVKVTKKESRKTLRDYGFKKIPFLQEDMNLFIGREKEMINLSSHLSEVYEDSIKKISLIGPTGSGKTAFMESYINLMKNSKINLNFSYMTFEDFKEAIIEENLEDEIFSLFIDSPDSEFTNMTKYEMLKNLYGDNLKSVVVSISPIYIPYLDDSWENIFLGPLPEEDIKKIIVENLHFCKRENEEGIDPFTENSIERIAYFSMGNPGLSKKISYEVLLKFMKSESDEINNEFVNRVMKEIFSIEEKPSYNQINEIMQDNILQSITTYLLTHNRGYISAMAEELKINRRILLHKMRYLMEEGVVSTCSEGRRINYKISYIWSVVIEGHLVYNLEVRT